MKKTLLFIGLCLSLFVANAQTYTFECVASGRLSGDSCDICPNTIVESRSFNGLVIFRDSVFYRWLDQPYSIRVKPGGIVEYWEHGANPYSERVTIPLSLTGFSTIQGMADSTWCNSPGPQRYQNLSLDSISTTTARVRISGSNTGFGLKEGTNIAFSYIADTLVVSATGSSITANNGLSDNEAGGVYRLGNRYMNGSDGPFGTDRKVNVNAFMGFFGDNSDSLLFIVDGTNDRVGVGRLPQNRLDVAGSSGTYARVGTSGAVANAGFILNNSADLADTWAVYRQGDGDFAIGADADNEWPNGTLTDPFIIKPSPPDNSFYMDAAGFIELNGTAPARRLDVNGETRIRDLVTDNPTLLVGADADGDLSGVTLGTNLSFTGTTLNATGGSFYQTMRDNGVDETQRAALNFISGASVSVLLTDDAANGETEAAFAIPNNAVTNALLRQGVARSVIGVTGNATANVADIQGTADQVLRVTTAGTALAFGTVATGGLANDAVTYAKIQNVAADDVFLGRISGAGGNVEELTAANAYTILGLTGVANRFALWTGTNTLASDAAFTFDAANDRATFTGTVAGSGANNAFLNLNSGAITGTTEFLRMSGNINGNMYAGLLNSNNTSASNHSIFQIMSGGTSAGDALIQFTVSGAMTHSIGIDNTDDRFKITPNSSTPGGNANMGIIVRDNGGTGNTGINLDFPSQPLDGIGNARFELWMGTGNEWTSGNIAFGAGAGTGPGLTSIVGTGNSVRVTFTTGTTPTADGDVFTISYPFTFPTTSIVTFSGRDADAAQADLYISAEDGAGCTLKVKGTLPASTGMAVNLHFWGY